LGNAKGKRREEKVLFFSNLEDSMRKGLLALSKPEKNNRFISELVFKVS